MQGLLHRLALPSIGCTDSWALWPACSALRATHQKCDATGILCAFLWQAARL